MVLGAGVLRAHTSSLLLAVALLRLVVVPSLSTRKTPARGPLYFYHGLLRLIRHRSASILSF